MARVKIFIQKNVLKREDKNTAKGMPQNLFRGWRGWGGEERKDRDKRKEIQNRRGCPVIYVA